MSRHALFLSVVCVVRNEGHRLKGMLEEIGEVVASLATDFEVVVVDNASDDDTVAVLRSLTQEGGMPNLQVYALVKEVDPDVASWVGLENALGDFVAVLDPVSDHVSFLPSMLESALGGAEVVFAANEIRAHQSLPYRVAYSTFNSLFKWASGVNIAREAPNFRLLSKRVVNYLLQHPQPALTYKFLPANAGFSRANLSYRAEHRSVRTRRLFESIRRGLHLMVSTTTAPMRLVTALSLFGAAANVVYSIYVLAIAVFKADVAPGWVSLSLQQSGMFFLISLVLMVLGEYVISITVRHYGGPMYYVAQEFTSARLTRREKLNVEELHRAEPRPRGVSVGS
jgi:hypothetical protein